MKNLRHIRFTHHRVSRTAPAAPVALLAFALLLSSCELATNEAIETSLPPVLALSPAPSPMPTTLCVDGSKSVPEQTRAAVLAAFSRAFSNRVKQLSAASSPSLPTQGLDLAVRRIAKGTSMDPESQLMRVRIPGVDGLPPKPDAADPNIGILTKRWRELDAAVALQRADAASSTQEALNTFNGLTYATKGSELIGCVDAAAQVQGATSTVVLISDLIQTGVAQVSTQDLTGLRVHVVQICNIAAECEGSASWFREQLEPRGATIEFHRPENAGDLATTLLT